MLCLNPTRGEPRLARDRIPSTRPSVLGSMERSEVHRLCTLPHLYPRSLQVIDLIGTAIFFLIILAPTFLGIALIHSMEN